MRRNMGWLAALAAALAFGGLAWSGLAAQERGTIDPKPLPPLADPTNPRLPAKQVFGRALEPAELQARSIGFYARGCLAGAEALPISGSAWQVMRLSRNRNWGNPALIAFLERFAKAVPSINGWPGLLVGDISQPRGGPMLSGHASHQIGLDADIWLSPMPQRALSREEREMMSATNVVRPDGLDVDPSAWTPEHLALIRGGGPAARSGAHLRQSGDQEGDLPGGDRRSQLAHQGAADVRPQLPLPCPHRLPGGGPELPGPGTGAARRGMRRLAGLVVPARRAPPSAEPRRQAETAADRRPAARGLPAGAGGAVRLGAPSGPQGRHHLRGRDDPGELAVEVGERQGVDRLRRMGLAVGPEPVKGPRLRRAPACAHSSKARCPSMTRSAVERGSSRTIGLRLRARASRRRSGRWRRGAAPRRRRRGG